MPAILATVLIDILIAVAVTVVMSLLISAKSNNKPPDPDQIDSSTFPETRDKPIPEVFGKVKLRSGNTVWHGNHRNEPIIKKTKGAKKFGVVGSRETIKTTVGYKYFTSMQFVLCRGPVTLHRIWEDEKVVYDEAISSEGRIQAGIYKAGDTALTSLFQPFHREVSKDLGTMFGGFVKEPVKPDDVLDLDYMHGYADFFPGTQNQSVSEKLKEWLNEPKLPRYRNIAHLVWDDAYIGKTTQLRPIFAEVSRYPKSPLGNAAWEIIEEDANPAYVLYELAKEKRFARMDAARIDPKSFEEVAEICFNEKLGISFSWETPSDYEAIKTTIETHCGLRMRQDPATGKVELIALRTVDDIASLPLLDKSNIIDVLEYSKPSLDILNTEIRAQYLDRRSNYKARHAVTHNIGTINNRRIRSIVDKKYSYFTRGEVAQWAADRDLLSMTDDITSVRLKVNRDAITINLGDAVRVRVPHIGDMERIYRVREVSLGSLTSNSIELDLIEDIWGRGLSISTHDDTIIDNGSGLKDPQHVSDLIFVEVPIEIEEFNTLAFIDAPVLDSGHHGAYLVMEEGGEFGFVSDPDDLNSFSPGYELSSPLLDSATSAVILANQDLFNFAFFTADERRAGGGLCLLYNADTGEQEFISYSGYNYDTNGNIVLINLWRGLFDTVPIDHASGARVLLMEEDFAPLTNLIKGQEYRFKAITVATGGELKLADATTYSFTPSSRYELPNAPGWATVEDDVNGDMMFTIKRRSNDYSQILPINETLETGSVKLAIYDASNDALLHTETVEAGSYTWATEIEEVPQEPVLDAEGNEIPQEPVYTPRYPETYTVITGWDNNLESKFILRVDHVRA